MSLDENATAKEVLSGIDLSGRLVVLTGATSGIGVATALALVEAGADLVIGARSADKLEEMLNRLRGCATGTIYGFPLDLMSLDSVDAFAEEVLNLKRPVGILINNAGTIGQLKRTPEGIESQLMTNFIGHGLLTSKLSAALQQATAPRLVSLTSFGHHYSPVHLDDLNFEQREYSAWTAYGQSKTACVLLAVQVANVMGIDAFAVHPGAIMTGLGKEMTADDMKLAIDRGSVPAPEDFLTAEQGAATTVWAATAAELAGQSPLYLENCGIAEIREKPNYQSGVMPYALDPEIADKLWQATEKLINRELPLR